MTFISRRDLLKGAALAGAAAASATGTASRATSASAEIGAPAVPVALQTAPAPLETLTATEADILDHIVARLIPTDANGPGAREAGAVRYIDRALGGALSSARQAYTAGLAAVDRYARASRGRAFTELDGNDQDGVLSDVEGGTAAGFAGSSSGFFNLVLNHTIQGTFGDPHYGGNANFIGWDLIGYPGVRTAVTPADQQRLERDGLPSNHKAAYDYNTFTKASASADSHDGLNHAD